MGFIIGEKVVCVNAEVGWLSKIKLLQKDKDYIIREVCRKDVGVEGIFGTWDASRFRKLDYSFAEEVLSKAKEDSLINI